MLRLKEFYEYLITGDTASNLGNAMDELMRHQPSLKTAATSAIIKLLEEVCTLGRDPKYICSRPTAKVEPAPRFAMRNVGNNDAASSDEEEEDEEGDSSSINQPENKEGAPVAESAATSVDEEVKQPVPLLDYILNVVCMKLS